MGGESVGLQDRVLLCSLHPKLQQPRVTDWVISSMTELSFRISIDYVYSAEEEGSYGLKGGFVTTYEYKLLGVCTAVVRGAGITYLECKFLPLPPVQNA